MGTDRRPAVLAILAALGLALALGVYAVSRGPFGAADPQPSISPAASPAAGSAAATPVASPSPTTAIVKTRVYFARDGLPPVGVDRSLELEPGMSADRLPVEQHIGRLFAALGAKTTQVPAGAIDAFPRADPAGYHGQRVAVAGDLATIDFEIRRPNGDWGIRGTAQSQALLQQIVYTATEVPGIRRTRLLQNGSPLAIDQLVIEKPLSREDVFGYARSAAADRIESEGRVVPATLSAEIDHVQTGGPGQPVSLVIDLAPRVPVAGGSWLPDFVAGMRQAPVTSAAKYELEVMIKSGTDTTTLDRVIDVTPLRYIAVQRTSDAMTYRLGLDDARPWRVMTAPFPNGSVRLYVDVGGVPGTVNQNIAVYAPMIGQTMIGSITIAGAARVYEANVSWRLRDSGGREVAKGFTTATNGSGPVWGSFQTAVPIPSGLSGRATLEVFWASPRDGSDQDVVSIPLRIR